MRNDEIVCSPDRARMIISEQCEAKFSRDFPISCSTFAVAHQHGIQLQSYAEAGCGQINVFQHITVRNDEIVPTPDRTKMIISEQCEATFSRDFPDSQWYLTRLLPLFTNMACRFNRTPRPAAAVRSMAFPKKSMWPCEMMKLYLHQSDKFRTVWGDLEIPWLVFGDVLLDFSFFFLPTWQATSIISYSRKAVLKSMSFPTKDT